MSEAHNPFTTSERRLAERLGVSHKELRKLRAESLERDVHWTHGHQGEVFYSDAGVAQLAALAKIPDGDAAAFTSSPAASPPHLAANPPPDAITLTVTRCPINRRIVLATDPDGNPARVRVRDNGKLRPGMRLTCHHIDADLYSLAQRLPRWIGKR